MQESQLNIRGVIIDSWVDNLNPTAIYTTIITRDPFTGENITLHNVVLRQSNPVIPDTIIDEQECTVVAIDYESYRKKIINTMYAMVVPEEVNPINRGLPRHAKVSNHLDSFASRPSAVCKGFNDKVEEMNERMGMIYKRRDLTIVQGRSSGTSPTLIIHQGNSDICMTDANGKQFMNINSTNGIAMSAGQIDTGSSIRSKNSLAYAGFSGYENPVSEIAPTGTILTPHPKLLPNITKIVNTILPIVDMINLGRACKQAYDIIYKSDNEEDKAAKRKKLNEITSIGDTNPPSGIQKTAEVYK